MILRSIFPLILFLLSSCGPQGDHNAVYAREPNSVTVGAKVLLQNHLDDLQGKRVGLVMNPTARVDGTHMLDTLISRNVNVTALFAPEHGFRGEAGAGETIKNGKDQATGLPVFSLYGATRKPTGKMLSKVDVLLFDMQDVGARFYTYISTLGLVLEAAAPAEVPVWVLDRPNPAGGNYVAGWTMQEKYQSFVGKYPITMAHGMTLGELAKMMIGEQWLEADQKPQIKVIKMKGWTRAMKWPDTGLAWHPPSPNLPHVENAYAYLGTVLFEGTNISAGRGTPEPFLTIGSPHTKIDDQHIDSLRSNFPAVSIEHINFTPKSLPGKSLHPTFEDEECRGVRLHIKDYDNFHPVTFGVALLKVMMESTPDARFKDYIYKLAGSADVKTFRADWNQAVKHFKKQREPYLLYQ